MNKFLKVALFNIIAIGLLFTNIVPVFATITQTTNKSNINVAGLEAGVNVNLYKIASVNYDYDLDSPQDNAYSWVTEVQNWIDLNRPNYSNPENFAKEVENMSEEAKEFYDELISCIKDGTINLPATESIITTGEKSYPVTADKLLSSISFENKDMGTYLVLIENGYRVYSASVVNLVPRFDETESTWKLSQEEVVVKSSTPTISQTITNDVKVKDNYSTTQEFNICIVADIPTYLENSISKTYKITGEVDESIELNKTSFRVFGINGNSVEELTMNWTKSASNNTFEIDLDYDSIKGFERIKVEYSAVLKQNNSLKLNEDGNIIKASLVYSNNPYEENSIETMNATDIIVYTYGIEISKIDKSNNQHLSGAEFNIKNSSGNLLYFVKESDGVYYLANQSDENSTATLRNASNGMIYIKGLDEGTYTIKEIHAPDGYNISSVEYDLEIVDNDLDGKIDGDNDGIISISIPNTKAFFIPLTGGNGIYMFVICGAICTLAGIIALFVLKKNKKK